MGIDDRDYMKGEYWERQGKKAPSRWSFNKAERDAARKAAEDPPGGASRVGENTSFDQYDRTAAAGFSRIRNQPRGQHGRTTSKQTLRHVSTGTRRFAAWAIPILCLATYVIPILADLRRGGWLPDTEPGIPFPETGSVSVASDLPMKIVRSQLTVVTSDSNAVVQLVHPETERHVISVFVAANSEVTIPAPVGIWRMRVIEGQKWHGNAKFFGPNTQYETVAELMDFGHSRGNGIDLHRRIDGNLKTRQMLVGPEPL